MRKRASTRESASGRGLPELPDQLEFALTMLRDLPIGLSALWLLRVKQLVVLGSVVLGVCLFLGAIIFVVWMIED
jgi:hypothetical protein